MVWAARCGVAVAGACVVAAVALMPLRVDAQQRNVDRRFAEWAAISEPLPGSPGAIGFYSAGCLVGARALPLDGDGFARMRPSRNRGFGHPSLIAYLERLAAERYAVTHRLLLIGDVGLPRGGPMVNGHVSHQNGLDADVWYTTLAARPTTSQRERLSAASVVVRRKALRPTWSAADAQLLVAAADNPSVDRIFVSPPIKRDMCRQFAGAPWLYRIRPWWGHEDHFHVRLVCPPDSPQCRPQDALETSDPGCGADLDWWFSSEADREWRKLSTSTEPRQFPELPPACRAIGSDAQMQTEPASRAGRSRYR